MCLLRTCTPPLMNPLVPVSLNLKRSTKLGKDRFVQMNSLCGTVAFNAPPTKAPPSMRQVVLVSPSHPAKVLPSKRETVAPAPHHEPNAPHTATIPIKYFIICFHNRT